MADVDLVLIHGFWSGPATWDALSARVSSDDELSGVRIHRFGYESPKLRLPFSTTRIPDHTDIAQSFESYLSAETTRSTAGRRSVRAPGRARRTVANRLPASRLMTNPTFSQNSGNKAASARSARTGSKASRNRSAPASPLAMAIA